MTSPHSLTTNTSLLLDSDTVARIALAAAGVAGDVSVAIAVEAIGGPGAFVAAVHDGEDQALPLSNLTRQRIRAFATGSRVARILQDTQQLGLQVLTPDHELWPAELGDLHRAAPLLLWTRGDISVLGRGSIALTGTAAPTGHGIHMVIELSTGLAQRGWTITAGAGSGIDALALNGALAMGGEAVAVSAASIERVRLPEQVTVITEQVPGAPVNLRAQRRAKQLLAAISTKTIIVEAGISSGALRVAEAAHAMGRPVGVVPGAPGDPFSAGCQLLSDRHNVALVSRIIDVDRQR